MAEEEQIKQDEPIDWKQKSEEYLNGWKRAQADYQNREKELSKEREALRGIFEESLILEFLPVLDNLKSALLKCSELSSEHNAWIRGVGQVIMQFEDILKKFGVEKIDVLDKEFDPGVAEAAERKGDGDKVIEVVLDGYRKGERVIRAARVVVGGKK